MHFFGLVILLFASTLFGVAIGARGLWHMMHMSHFEGPEADQNGAQAFALLCILLPQLLTSRMMRTPWIKFQPQTRLAMWLHERTAQDV